MRLTAIKPLYHEGKLVQPGVGFDTTEDDAERRVKAGEAKAVKEKAAAKPKAETK
ncbi:hypothetical protein [Pseudomonas sp. UBA6310]|uniref:DUF7210 family protein n=1 Tax=Pseudomonas sp. UBA6310 TaxID=1947327 RepID=UPI002580729D|nr:hypothetical protein [Pseudomonas sp. UBA6310]